MRDYRLYLIDRITGHFTNRRDFSSDDDTSAMNMASGCNEPGAKELWRGVHMVKRWEAIPPKPSALNAGASTSLGA
jgi:hypothetical protein